MGATNIFGYEEGSMLVDPFEQHDMLLCRLSPRLFQQCSDGEAASAEAGDDCEATLIPSALPPRRTVARPASAPLLRGRGTATAEGSGRGESIVLLRRQELERDLKKQLSGRVRAVAQQELASSRERTAEMVRRKRAEAKETEARQREIIARAVSRGAERCSVPPAPAAAAEAAVFGGATAPAATGGSTARAAAQSQATAAERRSGAGESRQRAKAPSTIPSLSFDQLKAMIEGAFDRPLLMESHVRPRSHYEVLGVDCNATAAEIRARFNGLIEAERAREGGGDATRLEALAEAHAVLSDSRRRRDYDEARSGKPCPPRLPTTDKFHAELAERVELRKQHTQALDKQSWQELQEIIAKGTARATLSGSHKVKANEGCKPRSEAIDEKKAEADATCKAQWAKIKDIKARAAARDARLVPSPCEDPLPATRSSSSSEQYESVMADNVEKVAEKRLEVQSTHRAQRRAIQAPARGATKGSVAKCRGATEQRTLDDSAVERSSQLEAETKAQWAHINRIRARIAYREQNAC